MKTNQNIISFFKTILLTGLLATGACTEDINLKLNETNPRLVVDGRISTDTTSHIVRLTRSGSYFSNQLPETVSNARITITDDIQTIELTESEKYPGCYLTPSSYYGVRGRSYHLIIKDVDIDNDGESEVYEAESALKPVVPIDSVRLERYDIWDLWKVLLYAQDPVESKDYYSFSVSINDSILSDRYSKLEIVDDRFFSENYAGGVWVQSIQDEDYLLKDGDWVKLKVCGITEEFYQFLEAVKEETGFKAPLFSGPPANVPGNISNGALGFFQAYSYTIDSVRYKMP